MSYDLTCDCSCRALASTRNSSRSHTWRWNRISIYVFEKPLLRIAWSSLIWPCQISLWGGLSLQILLLWILILESLLWKVRHMFHNLLLSLCVASCVLLLILSYRSGTLVLTWILSLWISRSIESLISLNNFLFTYICFVFWTRLFDGLE